MDPSFHSRWSISIFVVVTIAFLLVSIISSISFSNSDNVIVVKSSHLRHGFPGYVIFHEKNQFPIKENKISSNFVKAEPFDGCSSLTNLDLLKDSIAFVGDGNCSYVQKILFAQAGNPVAIILTDTINPPFENDSSLINTPSAVLSIKDATKLIQEIEINSKGLLYQYPQTKGNVSFMFLALLAILTIYLINIWADAIRKRKSQLLKEIDISNPTPSRLTSSRIFQSTICLGVLFVISASCVLLLFFYFPHIAVYVAIVVFAIGAFFSLFRCLRVIALYSRIGKLQVIQKLSKRGWNQKFSISALEIIFLIFSAIFVIWWGIERNSSYAWILQDILGIALCVSLSQDISFPNLKVSSVVLIIIFCYDIFWVFISPYFFGESVMEFTAGGGGTSEQLPMLLKFPLLFSEFSGTSMLGYGDIVLPGLFISLCRRFDHSLNGGKASVYFLTSFCGYYAGLFVTILGLIFSETGQPALLYLVPFTLIPVSLVAHKRKELKLLWSGIPDHEIKETPLTENQGSEHAILIESDDENEAQDER